ncbi:hypothetical protein D3C78_1615160 [compost metagenome]
MRWYPIQIQQLIGAHAEQLMHPWLQLMKPLGYKAAQPKIQGCLTLDRSVYELGDKTGVRTLQLCLLQCTVKL